MVRYFYGKRLQCYLDNAASNASTPMTAHAQIGGSYDRDWHVNVTAYYACVDDLAYAFQHDHTNSEFPMCLAPVGNAIDVSRRLVGMYGTTSSFTAA
jgi:hypothetical protein